MRSIKSVFLTPLELACWEFNTHVQSHSWRKLKDRSYHNPKSTHHSKKDITWVHSCTRIYHFFIYFLFTTIAEHYRVPSLYSLFCQLNTEIYYICPCSHLRCLFLRCFFYLCLTHAPIFHRSMWMQRNTIWCIGAATFKMIAMSSFRSTSVLSVVKPKPPGLTAAALIPPLASPVRRALNPFLILLMLQ